MQLTLHTSVAVVVFPTPGGPDNKAQLNIEPSSLAAKNPSGKCNYDVTSENGKLRERVQMKQLYYAALEHIVDIKPQEIYGI